MGDGRYYTYYQFSLTLIMMVFLSLVLVGMISGYYKAERKQKWYAYGVLFMSLFVLGMLKVVEGVVPSYSLAYSLRITGSALFFFLYISTMLYGSCCLLGLYHTSTKRMLSISVSVTCMVILLEMLTGGRIFITQYRYYALQFSYVYRGFWLAVLFLFICGCFYVIRRKSNPSEHYTKTQLLSMLIGLGILPIVLYLVCMSLASNKIDLVECNLLLSQLMFINFMMNTVTTHGLSAGAFQRISDVVVDYVMVIDQQNNMIYANRKAKEASFLKKDIPIKLNHIEALFDGEAKVISHNNDKVYVQLKYEQEVMYFHYRYRPIVNNNETIGYILLFVDMTKVLLMIEDLKTKKQQSKAMNSKLRHHSEVVYHLEKEKRIGALIEEVVGSREKQMGHLTELIMALKPKVYEADYEAHATFAIEENAALLEDVRKAVSMYRQHFN